jgi:lipopolysaccharide transport system ATP-binding protein
VQTLCPRSMLLSRGRKVTEGATGAVIEEYVGAIRSHTAIELDERTDRDGTGRFRFTGVSLQNDSGAVDVPVTGEDLEIVLAYESSDGNAIRNPGFAIAVYTVLGALVLQLQSDVAGALHGSIPPRGEIRCRVPRLPLPAGRYILNLMGTSGGTPADWIQRAGELTVAEGDYYGSGRRLPDSHQTVLVQQSWSVAEVSEPAAR